MKRLSGLALRWLILVVVVMCLVVAYWIFCAFYVYTGDAFLNIYPNRIAPNVPGPVQHVFVHDGQHVKKGDLLFTIENAKYLDLFNEAAANYATAKLAKQQIKTTIASYEKIYQVAELNVLHYKKTAEAYSNLKVAFSQQDRLNAQYNYDTSVVTEEKAWINWQQQKYSLTPEGVYPTEEYAKAALNLAQENLSKTRVIAPADGVVTNMSLKVRQGVAAGEQLFAVLDFEHGWIRARLKESYVGRVHIGDKVTISLRMYPFEFIHGTVSMVGAGVNRLEASSSVITSPLPYMSQAEDWIQLDQRFPVAIRIDSVPKGIHLRVGSSARILIHRSRQT